MNQPNQLLDDAKVAELADALDLGYYRPGKSRFYSVGKFLAIEDEKTKNSVSAFLGTLAASASPSAFLAEQTAEPPLLPGVARN